MKIMCTFTTIPNTTIICKVAGGVSGKMVGTIGRTYGRNTWEGELRGSGLYFTDADGDTWRISAKDVTGLRRAA